MPYCEQLGLVPDLLRLAPLRSRVRQIWRGLFFQQQGQNLQHINVIGFLFIRADNVQQYIGDLRMAEGPYDLYMGTMVYLLDVTENNMNIKNWVYE